MNILLITHEFYPQLGGVANVLTNLYYSFQGGEEKLYVINPYTKNENLYDNLLNNNYKFKDFGNLLRKKNFYILTLLSSWKVISDKNIKFSDRLKLILYFLTKPKVFQKVIVNVSHLYPFLKTLDFQLIVAGHSGWILPLSFILSRIFNKKLITIAYGLDFLVKYRLSFKTYYFRNADKIIIITNQTKKIIKEIHHLKNERLEVIYVGIDLKTLELEESKEDLRSEFKIPKREFVILSVGRHVRRKNFQLVINALYEIKKLTPTINIHYYLIGEGPETESLKNLTKKLNLEKIITFLGSGDIETRNKFYKLSDLFIMPSITEKNDIEGFGIVFLEANYYKVPVIGTKTGGIVEAIVDGKTGFLIEQNDLNELVEKILVLYENESLRKKMGEMGHQRVVNEFLWEKIVQDYKKLFKSVIRNE